MTFWDKITGNDMDTELKNFESRIDKLPGDYQVVWGSIKDHLWMHGDFTGRKLMPILEGVVSLLEETAAEGISAQEALGNDIKGFCELLMGEEGSKSFRNIWRKQLNDRIAKRLGK